MTESSPPKARAGTPPERIPILTVAVLASLYALLFFLASLSAGPRGWGLHAAGFLPPGLRLLMFAVLLASVLLLWSAALQDGTPSRPPSPARSRPERPRIWLLAPLFLPLGAAFWFLRARTQLLGDGAVWLATVSSSQHPPFSEPLFAALWHAFAHLVRKTGHTPDAVSMSLFSMLCGGMAALLVTGIALEIVPSKTRWLVAVGLLLTLGVSQLYFGYIESYPLAAVSLLLYLWLALRRVRGRDPLWVSAMALALAISAHLSAAYLIPSYLFLIALEKRPLVWKLLSLALPFAFLAALLLVLGYRPTDWAAPIHAATSGMREGFEGVTFHRPYGFFSYGHLADLMNILLLAIPVPVILLCGWAAGMLGGPRPFSRPLALLAIAAIPGLLLTAWLMTPVAPAQDWDLNSILLLPTAVFAVAAARRIWEGHSRTRAALALLGISLASLLSFVLVNADEGAAVRRFAAVVNDRERVSRYGRAYGNSVLQLFYRDRGQYFEALPYARASVEAEPTNPRNWTNVGFHLMRLSRYEEAIPYLREGVRRGPGRWEGRYNLGLTYMKLDRYPEAIQELREAVRLQPNLPVLRHNLGLAYYRSGQADSALVVWKEVLTRWPDYAASLQVPSEQPTAP
ncbi:MAG TPA: tetratricopeptide repeat protein [Candidatus Dormibacteraeota bacterium]|nr:tetratricopeptide repeat protein [Candidatus Dormibacteraeota bacterium]